MFVLEKLHKLQLRTVGDCTFLPEVALNHQLSARITRLEVTNMKLANNNNKIKKIEALLAKRVDPLQGGAAKPCGFGE